MKTEIEIVTRRTKHSLEGRKKRVIMMKTHKNDRSDMKDIKKCLKITTLLALKSVLIWF